jgi:CRISPR-associated protein (TIGR03984 family)
MEQQQIKVEKVGKIQENYEIYIRNGIMNEEEILDLESFLSSFCINFNENNDPIYLLIYKHDEIILGIMDEYSNLLLPDGKELNPYRIEEIRMFTIAGELHVWKNRRGYKWRFCTNNIDKTNAGENATAYSRYSWNVYQVSHVMWGRNVSRENGTLLLIEPNRGMKLALPSKIYSQLDGRQVLGYLKVQNYFIYDDDGLISFVDARLADMKIINTVEA